MVAPRAGAWIETDPPSLLNRGEADKSAPRVDFAALQMTDQGAEIVFFEAKDFTNPELRKSGGADPEVIDQIERYSDLLRDNRDAVTDSYRRVCGNLFDLRGLADRNRQRHEILKGIADGLTPLTVNDAPRLIVFGFDADQRDGKNWTPHRNNICALCHHQHSQSCPRSKTVAAASRTRCGSRRVRPTVPDVRSATNRLV